MLHSPGPLQHLTALLLQDKPLLLDMVLQQAHRMGEGNSEQMSEAGKNTSMTFPSQLTFSDNHSLPLDFWGHQESPTSLEAFLPQP